MIPTLLLVLFALATALRLARGFSRRPPGAPAARPAWPSSGLLGWTASPLVHAALGVLAAATALRDPAGSDPLRQLRSRPAAPVATLSPVPAAPVPGERIPEALQFPPPPPPVPGDREPAPEDDPPHERALLGPAREIPPAPLAPEPPRGLTEERFRPIPGAPAPAGAPAGFARTSLRPGLSPLRRLSLGRLSVVPLPGLPAPRLWRAPLPAPAGLRLRSHGTLAGGLSSFRPGVGRTPGFLPTGPALRGYPAATVPGPWRAGSVRFLVSPRGNALQVTLAPPRQEPFPPRPNPSALNGTDLRRTPSELNGTTLRPLPQGLSGTDLRGRR